MSSPEPSSIKTRLLRRRLVLIAATLFAVLLIVALAIIGPVMHLHSMHPNTLGGTSKRTPTPAVSQTVTGTQTSPAGTQSGGLYITNSSGILKLDPNTGMTLQSYPWPNTGTSHLGGTIEPYTLQKNGKLLFVGFRLLNSAGHVIDGGVQAFDTSKGEMLWEFEDTTYDDTALTIANGTVYISVGHPDLLSGSQVFALRATDGKQLAEYDLPLYIQQLTVADGFLYPIGYEKFYGVNLATRATWHIPGPQGAGVGFSDLHVVHGVLYVALYNYTTGSFILALNPATGQELWRTQAFQGQIYNFTIVHNVTYFGMAPMSNSSTGRLDAYDLSQRKLRWEVPAGSVARTYAVANGMVYAVIRSSSPGGIVPSQLIALSTRNGHQRWDITAGSVDMQQLNAPLVTTNGHIYIASDTPNITTDNFNQYVGRHIEMLNQASGNTIWNVSFSSQTGGYVLIS